MKKASRYLIGISLLLSLTGFAAAWQKHSYRPPKGFVPDETTAIRIAVAVWLPLYGEKQIESEKPYTAKLRNGVWTVEGSLPEGRKGGVAVAEIAKSDARVLRVSHGE